MTEWLAIFKDLGLPIGLIVVMCVGFYKAAGWTSENVFKPIVSAAKSFLINMEANQKQIAEAISKMEITQQLLINEQVRLNNEQVRLNEKIDKLNEGLEG